MAFLSTLPIMSFYLFDHLFEGSTTLFPRDGVSVAASTVIESAWNGDCLFDMTGLSRVRFPLENVRKPARRGRSSRRVRPVSVDANQQ